MHSTITNQPREKRTYGSDGRQLDANRLGRRLVGARGVEQPHTNHCLGGGLVHIREHKGRPRHGGNLADHSILGERHLPNKMGTHSIPYQGLATVAVGAFSRLEDAGQHTVMDALPKRGVIGILCEYDLFGIDAQYQ
jgi:hypothetical protein